jgi:alpha-tubulin suppressor-like RCC1 family protein
MTTPLGIREFAAGTLVTFSLALTSCGGGDEARPALPQLVAGDAHTVALEKDGTLWAWGSNQYGQLGNGTDQNSNVPVQLRTDATWQSVSTRWGHTVAITRDGTIWAWGHNAFGELGNGTNTDRLLPVQIGTDGEWLSASAGTRHTVAVRKDGTLWAWGANQDGQLGNATHTNSHRPVRISK